MNKKEKDIIKLLDIDENAKPDKLGFIENGHTKRRKEKEKNCQEFLDMMYDINNIQRFVRKESPYANK